MQLWFAWEKKILTNRGWMIRPLISHIATILELILLKLFLDMVSSSPADVITSTKTFTQRPLKMRVKPLGLSTWVNFASQDWLSLVSPGISEGSP